MNQEAPNIPPTPTAKKPLQFRLLKWIGWLLVLLLLLFGLLVVLIQLKPVQNWLINNVTSYLSKELDTPVTVDRLDIDFFDKLVLEDFYVEDFHGDTLIYSEALKVNFNTSLRQIVNKNLAITDLTLENPQFRLSRYPGEQEDQFKQLLSRLSKAPSKDQKEEKKAGTPFFLDIDAVYLRNASFLKQDSVGGEDITVLLERGDIHVDALDLSEKVIKIHKAVLSTPYVTLINYPKSPLPEDSTAIAQKKAAAAITVDSLNKKWKVLTADCQLLDGYFEHHNYRSSPVKKTAADEIDYHHLKVSNIQIKLVDFEVQDWVFIAEAKQFSLRESSGFVLDNLKAKRGRIAPTKVELQGMELITPYTHLKDSLIFHFKEYPDFKDFPNKVRMEGHFDNAYIAVRDIMHFAPKLRSNALFAENIDEVIYIDGIIKGKVNSLKGRNLNLNLGDLVRLKGKFSSYNLTTSDETYLNMELERLQTSMQTLRLLVPKMSLPENFNKLGQLDFTGRFTGFYSDFVANGVLNSDLGAAKMNLKLDLKEGRELATYNGKLELINFDLANWADNDNFGLVTFKSTVDNGIGLTQASANATLNASIDRFTFKGYNYENLAIKGNLTQKLFSGDFSIADENIDFRFDGTISFVEKLPEFKFKAEVDRLDLKSLKLIEQDYVLSGDIDLALRGLKLDDLQGFAALYDVKIAQNGTEEYFIDTLKANAVTLPGKNQYNRREKAWRFKSEIADADLVGDFTVSKIGEAVLQFVEKNYVGFADRFNIHSKGDTSFVANQFELDVHIKDTKNFTALLDKKLDTIRDARLALNFDYAQDSFKIDLNIPTFQYDNVMFDGITLASAGFQKQSGINFKINGTNVNDQFQLAPVRLWSFIENDSAKFSLNTKDLNQETDRLDLNGTFSLVGNLFNFQFDPSNLVILNEDWRIEEDNYLQIGKNFIKTNNFALSNGERRVALTSLEDKGLQLEVNGFNTHYINEIWSYKNLQFEGIYKIDLQIKDLFAMEKIHLNTTVDTFFINGDKFGEFIINAHASDIKSPVILNIATRNEGQKMSASGFYNPPTMSAKGEAPKYQPNYIDVVFNIDKYPLSIAEYFVTTGITNTVGNFDARLVFNGLLPKPNMDGTLQIVDGATTLDYTGVRYLIPNEKVKMTNEYLFDATGGKIMDELGNIAYVTGGITHDFFKNLGLNVRVNSDHFLVLNTSKEDNEVYYGTGIGKGDIRFSGDFNQTNLDITAETAKGTKVFIPVTSSSTVEGKSFIRFVSQKDTVRVDSLLELNKKTEIRGMKLHMELTMNDQAEVQLIFDEKVGDIMKGTGFGNIKMDMTRQGDISMYGHYEIEQGEYLFTFFNLVNKPFSVKRGGTIDWAGDPYNAIINIDAEYRGLHAAPYNFLLEYLNEDNIKAEAKQATDVGLTMELTGQLLKPDIVFDINFPSLTGELKNYTDSKMRSIRLDENELNRQVFGLIVIGAFLPTDQGGLQGRELLTGINTISELLSNQLSIYLTEFFSSAVSGNFLSLEDFDVAYNVYESSYLNDPNALGTGHEVHLRQRSRIKDRWIVNTAVGVDLGGGYVDNEEALVTTDVIIEYELTKDRRLKIRGYYKNEPELFGGRKNNAGLGLSFRREFDNLDLLNFLKKSSKERKPKRNSKRKSKSEKVAN